MSTKPQTRNPKPETPNPKPKATPTQPNGGDGQTGDDGRGRGGTDRHNVVLLDNLSENYPKFFSTFNSVRAPAPLEL